MSGYLCNTPDSEFFSCSTGYRLINCCFHRSSSCKPSKCKITCPKRPSCKCFRRSNTWTFCWTTSWLIITLCICCCGVPHGFDPICSSQHAYPGLFQDTCYQSLWCEWGCTEHHVLLLHCFVVKLVEVGTGGNIYWFLIIAFFRHTICISLT